MTLNQTIPLWMTNKGIFRTLASTTGITLPWHEETEITGELLDLQYIGNHSGQKEVSPLVNAILDSAATYTGILTDADLAKLVTVIWSQFYKKWDKLWDTLNFEYNPIENYDRTETKEGTDTITDTPTNWKDTVTDTPTNWKEITEGTSANNESNSESSVYGFNSSSAVPAAEVKSSVKNKQETTRSGSYTKESTRSGIYEKETEYDTEINVHGNIGVTTSQQMIQSERELWMWDYFDQVFKDVDKVLTLHIY